jgi:hypothetical protein
MAVWLGPDPAIPVLVRNPDAVESAPLLFAFTTPVEALAAEAEAEAPTRSRRR